MANMFCKIEFKLFDSGSFYLYCGPSLITKNRLMGELTKNSNFGAAL